MKKILQITLNQKLINTIDMYCKTYNIDNETKQKMQVFTGIIYSLRLNRVYTLFTDDYADEICGDDFLNVFRCCMQCNLFLYRQTIKDDEGYDVVYNYFKINPILFDKQYIFLHLEIESKFRDEIILSALYIDSLLPLEK